MSKSRWSIKIKTVNFFRLTITANCPMNLQYFPLDRQLCYIEIESCKLIQVSLAIRGVYVPEKSLTAYNKTGILGPI